MTIERQAGARPLEQRETALERREREALAKARKGPQVRPGPLLDRPRGEGEALEAPDTPPAEALLESGTFTPRKHYRDRRGRYSSLPPEPLPEGSLRLTPRQPRAQLVKAVVAWLRHDLAKGGVAAAAIRAACRARKIPASVLREARQRAHVVSWIAEDGVEVLGVLNSWRCPACGVILRCANCQRLVLHAGTEGPMYDLKTAAWYCMMEVSSLRSYLSRHKAWYTPRFRKDKGGRRRRVLSAREVQMLAAYAIRAETFLRRQRVTR